MPTEVVQRLLVRGAGPVVGPGEIDQLTAEVAEGLGYRDGCYYRLSEFGRPILPVSIFGADVSRWRERYSSQGFQHHDPAIQAVFRSPFPFTLGEIERHKHDAVSQRLFDERRAQRSYDAAVCPVFGPMGERGCLVLSSDTAVELDSESRFYLRLIADLLVNIYRRSAGPEIVLDGPWPSLSPRESECLFWLSQGKSASDTAVILGLSVHTVRGYIESTMEKVGAGTREEMMLRAVPFGLLVSHR